MQTTQVKMFYYQCEYGTIYTGIDAGHTREDILLSM